MERDNITICAALKAYGYTEPIQITQIMGIDYSHAYSLLQQVEENETLGTPKPYLISPHPILPLTWAQQNPPGDPNRI